MELEPWLVLLHATLPPATAIHTLLQNHDAATLVTMGRTQLCAAGLKPDVVERIRQPDERQLEASRTWLARDSRALIPISSAAYPPLLRALPDPPIALWIEGDPSVLMEPQVAVVGSRNPTRGGLDNARQFARALGDAGLTVTSGLALGIDGAGHAGALDSGAPTIAVFGSGLDVVYPRQHCSLAETIADQGAIVSEYIPGTPPTRHHFPLRNRIIAGLCLGILVVEATRRSGSLITARLAGDYGRDVFAIPGSIHNPMARGCHQLIRDGAKLVEQAGDILRELEPQLAPLVESPPAVQAVDSAASIDSSYRELLEAMAFDPLSVLELTQRSGLTAAELSSMLLVLELEGFVEALPGGRYLRIGK